MSWAKLDDQLPFHPKVLAAGSDAAWLYVASLCYANAQLTDGFVPAGMLRRLTDHRDPEKLAARLVSVRLFEQAEGGFLLHDFLDWNDSAEEVKAKRAALSEKRKAAGVAGGKRSGESRRQASAKQDTSKGEASCFKSDEAKANPDADADADAVLRSHVDLPADPVLVAVASVPRFDFTALYSRYPRKEGKDDGMRKAKATIRTAADFAAFSAAVDAYAAMVRAEGREKSKILLWSTFVGGRWTDYAAGADGAQPSLLAEDDITAAQRRLVAQGPAY